MSRQLLFVNKYAPYFAKSEPRPRFIFSKIGELSEKHAYDWLIKVRECSGTNVLIRIVQY